MADNDARRGHVLRSQIATSNDPILLDSENSSMHECVRETPLRFPIALLFRALLWRSSGLGVARRLQKLFHDLSRLSTGHGVCWSGWRWKKAPQLEPLS